ncbi:TonB-dependent receptor [Acinetobacter rathckeae]|uniref:TonB-dependent receptor n=1 Tax=Acinetobacter rathckeae TaxID=2605272 RepID=UPI0018A27A1E|nr:TonB-dependent receptor [Acinetobacter rathckeae]MBF7688550.1 TonB-dependent hemoglobin/transferrin/lactoferrin family receptor [Acinetobacter rathckeae]MBF7695797.1 TonB-dependent hemoglobin/transferrin/lactoferrin family receptor [Acinetobacter rathckeae]
MQNSSRQYPLQKIAFAVSLAISISCISTVVQAQTTSNTALYFTVDTGRLTQALNTVAMQANVSLLFDANQTNDYQVDALHGNYTVEQAFLILTRKTPFQIVKKSSGYVLVNNSEFDKKVATPLQKPDPNVMQQSLASSIISDQNQMYQMPTIYVQVGKVDVAQFGQSRLNQTMINRYQANNVAQLLDTMPGVATAGSPRPGGQTINILGKGGVADVPVTVDGALKTFDKYRQGSVFIEPEVLKMVTVDKGPHNVEVGNGGFGGKVTLETKDAQDLLENDRNIGAFVKYSRFSNNQQNTYTGAVYGKSSHNLVDGLLYFTQRDSGNVKRPDGTAFLYSAQTQDTYLAKFNIHLTDEQKISLNAMQSSHSGWEPFAAMRDQDATPTAKDIALYGYDEAWKRRLVFRDQKDSSYSVGYELKPIDNPYIHFSAKATYSQTQQHDQRLPSVSFSASNLGDESWVKYQNSSIKLMNTAKIETDDGIHTVKTGIQYQNMKQNALMLVRSYLNNPEFNYGLYQPNYMPAGDQQMYSAFIEDQYQIASITLAPSLRYDDITNQGYGNIAPRYSNISVGQNYTPKTYTGWTPRLALAWKQAEYLTWFANVSKTWRAPRVDEQYYTDGPSSTVPATSLYLKPERMLALRFGNEANFDDVFTKNDHLQLRLTYYHNRGSDEIFRNRSVFCKAQADLIASGKSTNSSVCNGDYNRGFYRNITDYTIKSYEAELFYNQPNFFAGLTYSYIRGQRDNSPVNPWFNQRTWIEETPPRKATATMGLVLPEHQFTIGWRGVFVDAQKRSILNTDNSIGASGFSLPRTKGYALHSIFMDWQLFSNKGPQLNLSIDNLFNRDYKIYLGEYMTGTGRDFKLSISQKF